MLYTEKRKITLEWRVHWSEERSTYFHFMFGKGRIAFKDMSGCQVLSSGRNTKSNGKHSIFFVKMNYGRFIWSSIAHFVQRENKTYRNVLVKQRNTIRK